MPISIAIARSTYQFLIFKVPHVQGNFVILWSGRHRLRGRYAACRSKLEISSWIPPCSCCSWSCIRIRITRGQVPTPSNKLRRCCSQCEPCSHQHFTKFVLSWRYSLFGWPCWVWAQSTHRGRKSRFPQSLQSVAALLFDTGSEVEGVPRVGRV